MGGRQPSGRIQVTVHVADVQISAGKQKSVDDVRKNSRDGVGKMFGVDEEQASEG
jgi:hypothetical protein